MVHWPPSLKIELAEGSRGVGSARTDASWSKRNRMSKQAARADGKLTWRRARRAVRANMWKCVYYSTTGEDEDDEEGVVRSSWE